MLELNKVIVVLFTVGTYSILPSNYPLFMLRIVSIWTDFLYIQIQMEVYIPLNIYYLELNFRLDYKIFYLIYWTYLKMRFGVFSGKILVGVSKVVDIYMKLWCHWRVVPQF